MAEEKSKEIRITKKEDLEKLTKPQIIDLMGGFMEIMKNLTLENEQLKNNKKSVKEVLQEEIDILEVNRRRILTIMEIVNNVSGLIEQRVNDTGSIDLRYVLDEDVKTTANNTIRNGLEQMDVWLKENNINKLKLKKNETTEKNTSITSPDSGL